MTTKEEPTRAYLVAESGAGQSGEAHPIGSESTMIGRDRKCQIQLPDSAASRKHARIVIQGDRFFIEDLGSRNGTLVNGLRVERAELHQGDVVRLGSSAFAFVQVAKDERPRVSQDKTLTLSSEMLGASAPMLLLAGKLRRLAATDSTVLVLGETGTGKELAARLIHRHGARAGGPFVTVNCGAIPESLVESELFGHEAGAFTGAKSLRLGAFERAHRGTLFLDEVGELPEPAQVALLRALEEGCVRRIGGDEEIKIDTRMIAATHRDPKQVLREDLYFRLSVVTVLVPPLRERGDDIVILARDFLRQFARKAGRKIVGLSDECLQGLKAHPWPGNVRELKNAVERAAILGTSPYIQPADLGLAPTADGFPTLEQLKKEHIRRALEVSGGDRKKAQELLGIPRSTFYEKLKEFGLG